MGAGSRIDHQHHLVAVTAPGPALEIPDDLEHPHNLLHTARALAEGDDAMDQGLASVREVDDFSARSRAAVPDATTVDAGQDGSEERSVLRAGVQLALDEALAEHQAAAALQVHARDRMLAPEEESSYVASVGAFQAAYDEARARIDRGEEAVPYYTDDATGGLGSREEGRGFGLELEFDVVGGRDRAEALHDIAADLHAAGLSADQYVWGYHAQNEAGYTDASNAWNLEEDCTVHGELVSPILHDEPTTWENLATACEIIRRHGGRPTARAGGHVHVGLHDYDHDVATYLGLARSYEAYEDVLYRLAQNPAAANLRHRGTAWCRPNEFPSAGYSSLETLVDYAQHGNALNLRNASGDVDAHGEFRLWDSSLNPSVIQAQVNLSLGLVDAAVRNAASDHLPAGGTITSLGRHHADLQDWPTADRQPGGAAWETSTLQFRRLVDEVLPRPQQRAQAAALFAATHWQHR